VSISALALGSIALLRAITRPTSLGGGLLAASGLAITVLGILIIIGNFVFLSWYRSDYQTQVVNTNSSSGLNRNTSSNKAPVSSNATISAKELFTAYEANTVAADQKYKGKKIKITGTIAAAGTDLFGKTFALFEVGHSVNVVRCTFPDSAKSAVTTLKPKQPATFTGTVDGMPSAGDVMISNCSIVE